jgi:hypothetical protein
MAKPVQPRHEPGEVLEHVETIVDEVRRTDRLAVLPLLGSLATESHTLRPHAGAGVERLSLEPAPGELLDARPTLGDEPNLARKGARELGDGLEGPFAGGRREGGLVAAAEERGIGSPRRLGGADDHSANVDAEHRS